MRLGLVARADQGGLGTMTWEFFRHMRPHRTLVIDLGERGRGRSRRGRYDTGEVLWNEGMDSELDASKVAAFCRGLDVVYSAETLYRSDFASIARSVGCKTVLHAMPELWRSDMDPPDAVWAPTGWELGRLPAGTPVVPVPVASDRIAFRRRDSAKVFLHQSAPAMMDRNGTRLVLEALQAVTKPCKVVMVGTRLVGSTRIGACQVVWINSERDNYWDGYNDADVLLLPRRYAGLSLPMNEAGAAGMPIVSLDLAPQNAWLPPGLLCFARKLREVQMAGGATWVHDANPRCVAAKIDLLIERPEVVQAASTDAGDHGAKMSWEALGSLYRSSLEAVAG